MKKLITSVLLACTCVGCGGPALAKRAEALVTAPADQSPAAFTWARRHAAGVPPIDRLNCLQRCA